MKKDLASATFLPFFLFVDYVVPSILVLILFSGIARIAVKRQTKSASSSNSDTNLKIVRLPNFPHPSLPSAEEERQRVAGIHFKKIIQSKSFIYIVIIVVTNIFLLVAPYVVTSSYDTVSHDLGLHKNIPKVMMQLTTLLFIANFNINCLLYIFWIRTFQHATAVLCCRRHERVAASVRNRV